jgi:hypothetical protein
VGRPWLPGRKRPLLDIPESGADSWRQVTAAPSMAGTNVPCFFAFLHPVLGTGLVLKDTVYAPSVAGQSP